jgi:hypothetical protein
MGGGAAGGSAGGHAGGSGGGHAPGSCQSGAVGTMAFRIGWSDGQGEAYPVYEEDSLPDTSRDHAGAYGYTIPFTASYVDPFLGAGGVGLDSSDFIDLELSTVGLSVINTATLSIYGRSYDVSANGSFNWQTFNGTGDAPTDLVSNISPYQWYSADMTTEISPGDGMVLVRVKAGPSSDSLVVNRIEICIDGS